MTRDTHRYMGRDWLWQVLKKAIELRITGDAHNPHHDIRGALATTLGWDFRAEREIARRRWRPKSLTAFCESAIRVRPHNRTHLRHANVE
jgi:hypothetical protein